VSCPTWEDLRDIGELLSLHPLTLEDVLQQDPREKLDMFDKLGYYFVVVRALDETYFKYTPGTGSVASIGGLGKAVPSPALSGDSGSTAHEKEKAAGTGTGSPELVSTDEKAKEGRRRGWGMGRAVGKLAGRQGEKVEIVEDNPGREGLEGVGVGAVNVYLAVFEDGVVSVSSALPRTFSAGFGGRQS
jgi:Mg2+ and Co2+ transporter CorA